MIKGLAILQIGGNREGDLGIQTGEIREGKEYHRNEGQKYDG